MFGKTKKTVGEWKSIFEEDGSEPVKGLVWKNLEKFMKKDYFHLGPYIFLFIFVIGMF